MTGAADALARLTDVADWLRWRMGAPGEGELACVTLAASPEDVARWRPAPMCEDRRPGGAPRRCGGRKCAYRVGGTALACWLLTVAPDVRAERMAVGIARGRPSSVVYGSTETTADPGELSDWLFAGHLDPVASSLGEPAAGVRACVGKRRCGLCRRGGSGAGGGGDRWHDGLAAFLAAAPATSMPWARGATPARPTTGGPAACGGRRPHPAGRCAPTARSTAPTPRGTPRPDDPVP